MECPLPGCGHQLEHLQNIEILESTLNSNLLDRSGGSLEQAQTGLSVATSDGNLKFLT